ncbi:TonB-dependent receptor [Bacteroidia bacterium]|nr:TonB-dependent receptor [Bacteroidia bacterium]
MKNYFAIILLLLPWLSQAQIVIQGTVRNAQDRQPIDGVTMMMQEPGSPAISAYVLTDKEGKYRMEYKGGKDSLVVSASGFNIQKQSKTVARKSETLDFELTFGAISLKEVKITPPKIRQKGDTLNFSVDGFIDKNDRTIGDVLKKMPGIDVKESGQILYQNKPINKMYIEDSDLLQGRYGIATNNIEAKDVQSVQVLENHQPVKALQDKEFSEQAAINLKLKDSAKGTLIANALAGAGLPPVRWTGELSGMYFGKGKQNITTYKGNNTGNDVSRDLNSFYSRDADRMQEGGLLSVQSPSSPSISQKRYLFNRAHALTFNDLIKLKKDYQLNVNLNYLNDRNDKSSFSRTEYYLPGNEFLKIEEKLDSRLSVNKADAEIQLTGNTSKFYLNNLLKFTGGWNSERGHADTIHQQLNKPDYGVNNTFSLVKNYNKTTLNISSFTGYAALPHTLTVQPLLYENLFGTNAGALQQTVNQHHFASYNKASMGFEHGAWKHFYELGFRADWKHLDSELKATGDSNPPENTADSLRNDLQWNRVEWIFSPRYTYLYGDWRMNLSLPLNYTFLHVNDAVVVANKNNNRLYFNPSLFLQYKLSAFWDANVWAGYSHSLGGINREYSGYIMRSYRNLVCNTDNLYESATQTYNLRFSYRHPIRSQFGYLGLTHFNTKSNLLYGYDFDGILQVQTSQAIPNRTEGVSAEGSFSQTIDALSSTVRLGGNYSMSASSQLTQGEILRFNSRNYSLSPSVTTKIRSWSSFSYGFTFAENQSRLTDRSDDLRPIRTFSHNAQFNLFPLKDLTINLKYEYFYNNAITAGSRAMSFGDIGAKYKWKKLEFLLDYNNLFNAKQYISASYSDISSYYYAYDLRPAEIVLRVRFKLK